MTALLLRGGPWRAPAALVAAGALVGLAGLLGASSATRATQLGCLLMAVGSAYVLDEPAAEVADACPVSAGRRTAVRVVALGLLVGAVLATWSLAGAQPLLVVQGAGSTTAAVGTASAVRARRTEPGDVAASAVLVGLGSALVAGTYARLPSMFPPGPATHGAYVVWAVLVGAGLGALVVGADPTRRWRFRPTGSGGPPGRAGRSRPG